MEDSPPSSLLDGVVIGVKFGMATRQEIVSSKHIQFFSWGLCDVSLHTHTHTFLKIMIFSTVLNKKFSLENWINFFNIKGLWSLISFDLFGGKLSTFALIEYSIDQWLFN